MDQLESKVFTPTGVREDAGIRMTIRLLNSVELLDMANPTRSKKRHRKMHRVCAQCFFALLCLNVPASHNHLSLHWQIIIDSHSLSAEMMYVYVTSSSSCCLGAILRV